MVEAEYIAGRVSLSGSLVPDCGGLIQRIAFSLPATFFEDMAANGWFRPLVPIGNLLMALPADVEVLLLVDGVSLPKAQAWARGLQAGCEIALVPVPKDHGSIASPWIQDAFLVRTGAEAGLENLELLASQAAGPIASLAAFLQAPINSLPVLPPGGNQLVGPDFRLIGRSELKSRYQGSSAPAISVAGTVEALEELDERQVSIFGYRASDLSRSEVPQRISRCRKRETGLRKRKAFFTKAINSDSMWINSFP